jgi:hypothetical protein
MHRHDIFSMRRLILPENLTLSRIFFRFQTVHWSLVVVIVFDDNSDDARLAVSARIAAAYRLQLIGFL